LIRRQFLLHFLKRLSHVARVTKIPNSPVNPDPGHYEKARDKTPKYLKDKWSKGEITSPKSEQNRHPDSGRKDRNQSQ